MSLLANGSVTDTNSATSLTVSLITTLSTNVVVALVYRWNSFATEAVTGVTCGGVAMTKRSGYVASVGIYGGYLQHSVWYLTGVAAGTYSVVASFNSSNVNCLSSFGVNGVNQTTPWDVNGALPSLAGIGRTTTTTTHNVTYSTTHADTFIIASLMGISGGYFGSNPDTGYTVINGENLAGGGYVCSTDEYKIVSAAQSSVTLNIGSGGGATTNDWIGMIDALQAAGGSVPTVGFNMPMGGI